jgi:hypothetical protein
MEREICIRLAETEDLPPICEIISLVVPIMNSNGNHQWNSTYPLLSHFESDLEKGELWVATYDNNLIVGVMVRISFFDLFVYVY